MEDPMAPLMIMPANGAEDGEPEVFPEEMWLRVIQAVSDREEKILRMKEFKIYEVPSAISEATSLCVLDLSWNSIVDLPSSISCLTNLTELYVDHNALESLPDGVGNLTNLRILHLQANKLHYLPESLCRLPKLQHAKVVLNPFKFEEKPRFVELPSLLDLSLEKYLKNMDGQNNNNLPFDLLDRIDQANVCNWCEKKYFGKGVVLPRNMVIAKSVKAVYQGNISICHACLSYPFAGTVCSLKCAYEIYDDARLNSKKPVDFDNSQMNDITRSVNNMNKLMKSAYAKVQRKNMLVINPGAGFDEQKEKMLFLSFVIQILEITDEDDEKVRKKKNELFLFS